MLILILGEEIIRKIYSKYIYYKEEGFDILNSKVKEIIKEPKNTEETNKYIVLLIDIIYNFLDDRHPSIVYKCLDIFTNILEAIEEKSKKSKISYDFTITKAILNKIKEKLNDISKKVRVKASDLYCFMLETDFCEYNTLLIDMIEKEVFNYFNKYLIKINSIHPLKKLKKKTLYDNSDFINRNEVKASKQLIIAKMNIFSRVLSNFNVAVERKKTDKQKFPQNILGDYIIMNINHPKDDVREITKDVMVKFITIFGNKLFNKMQIIIDEKELNRIFQDKLELKTAFNNLKKGIKPVEEKKVSPNVIDSDDGLFLTNVNKVFKKKENNVKKKLLPISQNINFNTIKASPEIVKDKSMMRSSSQPKIAFKNKLKPISTKRNGKKKLVNSKSQHEFQNIKK